MKPLLTIFFFLLLIQATSAQSDSGYYDIGRMQLKKEFTQVTIIEADDLARIPFLSVSDVIRSQANGALTQKDQMVYVVDGIMVADIDAYNIQDIEDITIIRNALVNQNGAGNLQLLALVRTKQWEEGARHLIFSALGAALHRKVVTKISTNNRQTENVFSGNFQQYALTLRGGNQQISYGGSIGFVHDALPRRNNKDSLYDRKIPGIDRVKLNLWGRLAINKNNVLSAYLNYVPQTEKSSMHLIYADGITDNIYDDREHWINPYISLETRIPGLLLNKFTFGYVKGSTIDSTITRTELTSLGAYRNQARDSMTAETIQFNDNLSFIIKAGNWQIEPSLNINFQKIYYKAAMSEVDYDEDPLHYHSYRFSTSARFGKLLTATPSLAVSYDSLFLVQGGVLLDGSKIIEPTYKYTRSYPFINGAVNLARVLKPEAPFGWKIFGSYAERFSGFDGVFQVSDFNHSFVLPEGAMPDIYFLGISSTFPSANKLATQWQAGSGITIAEERVRINYNYLQTEQRQLNIMSLPIGIGIDYRVLFGKYLRKQQHFNIEADILRTDALRWSSGLFVNLLKNSSSYEGLDPNHPLVSTERPRTGGWTNRIQYKKFYAGADIVFLLNQQIQIMNTAGLSNEKHNTLQLSNLFIAYRINRRLFDGELFFSSRNLVDSATFPISPDNKKYFGGGFKVSL